MKEFREYLEEAKGTLEKLTNEEWKEIPIKMVRLKGNFFDGKYYANGIDSVKVLADTDEEAIALVKDNKKEVAESFKTKRYRAGQQGKTVSAIRKNEDAMKNVFFDNLTVKDNKTMFKVSKSVDLKKNILTKDGFKSASEVLDMVKKA